MLVMLFQRICCNLLKMNGNCATGGKKLFPIKHVSIRAVSGYNQFGGLSGGVKQTEATTNQPAKDIFIIKQAITKADYEFVGGVFKEEQWSAGAHMITHVGPIVKPGFFIGYLNGQRIGCASACKYGEGNDGFAFLGSYNILNPFRGKGYGSQLTNTVVRSLNTEWKIGLDAVINMVPKYEHVFGICEKSLNREYILSCSKVLQTLQGVVEHCNNAIHEIHTFNFDKLSAYDASVFGSLRYQYLKLWITIPESMGLVATNECGEIVGYAVMQLSVINEAEQIIGPMFSNDDSVTQLLLLSLAKEAINRKGADMLRITVPVEINPSLAKLLENEIGYNSYVDLIRMYTIKGAALQADMKKVVAVTSPALG